MFDFDLTDELRIILRKLSKKHKERALQVTKKIKEIVANDVTTIDRYYNCKYELKNYKHCHIDKSFVLLFEVDKSQNYILFVKLGHHDDFFK